jgi:hypothetical protein
MEKQNSFEPIKFSKYRRTWNSGLYGYSRSATYNLIKVNNKKEFVTYLKEKLENILIEKLPDNVKVFFSKNVSFPRAKFKEAYPTCSIVRDEKKADVIIYDKSKLKNSIGELTTLECRKLSDGTYVESSLAATKEMKEVFSSEGVELVGRNKYYILSTYWQNFTSLENVVPIILSTDNAKFIDVNSLNNENGEIMNDEAYEKIDSMLSSRTPDMMNLAVRMLTAYNYEKNRFKISKLIYYHWDSVTSYVRKNVEIKAMINKYNKEFGITKHKSHYYRGTSDTRFWLTQLEYYKDNEELSLIHKELVEAINIDTNILEFSIKRKDTADNKLENNNLFLDFSSSLLDEEDSNNDE